MSDVPQEQTEEVKPLEFTPIEVAAIASDTKVEDVKPVTESANTSESAAAAAEEIKDPETVSAGVLGYKAPGLLNMFKFTKRYFWFGDEAVSHEHLSNYLRGTEPRVAQQNAAWSSHTGKGLLYMTKTEAEKSHPQEIMSLADVTDLDKHAHDEFSFKIHGEKHTFKAINDTERDAWFTAIEKAIPEAKVSKESVHGSDKYQDTIKHLGAGPAAAAGLAVGATSADKEEAKEASEVPAVEETPARANSSTDDEAKAEKKRAKSRSISRSKRGSIFGALKGKKEEHNVKTAEKKEEKVEAKEEENKHTADITPVDGAAAPTVIAAEETRPVEVEEPIKTENTKPKRNSIFGSIYQKVRSPTHEKKESEAFAPVVPPKDEQLPAKDTSEPAVNAPETALPVATEEPKATESAPVVAPAKEKTEAAKPKSNFLGGFVERVRAKSPVSRKIEQKKDVVASSEAPAVPPKDEPVTNAVEQSNEVKPIDAAVVDAPKTEAVTTPEAVITPNGSRRRSYFAGFGQKKEKTEGEVDSDKPAGKFSSMFRKPSQMSRSNTSEKLNKKENVVPESTTVAETAEAKPTEASEPKTTGEAVPESITAEKVHQSTPTVSAAA